MLNLKSYPTKIPCKFARYFCINPIVLAITTFPDHQGPSIIVDTAFHFSVRNGKRWFRRAVVAKTTGLIFSDIKFHTYVWDE